MAFTNRQHDLSLNPLLHGVIMLSMGVLRTERHFKTSASYVGVFSPPLPHAYSFGHV